MKKTTNVTLEIVVIIKETYKHNKTMNAQMQSIDCPQEPSHAPMILWFTMFTSEMGGVSYLISFISFLYVTRYSIQVIDVKGFEMEKKPSSDLPLSAMIIYG